MKDTMAFLAVAAAYVIGACLLFLVTVGAWVVGLARIVEWVLT